MNPAVKRYAPPIVVFGAALYWGWPPSAPMDLGDDLVTARAVHWKAADLGSPRGPGVIVDPFRPVLVVKVASKQVSDEIIQVRTGPTEDNIRAVIKLTGIAKLGGRAWAIVNSKARVAGDTVRTRDKLVKSCQLIAIHPDHILVKCQDTLAVIRPQVSRGATTTQNESSGSANATPAKQTNQGAPPPDMGPSPQASIQRSGNGATQINTNQV